MGEVEAEAVDFASAEIFLQTAKRAHEQGDEVQSLAARRLVMVALRLKEGPRGNAGRKE